MLNFALNLPARLFNFPIFNSTNYPAGLSPDISGWIDVVNLIQKMYGNRNALSKNISNRRMETLHSPISWKVEKLARTGDRIPYFKGRWIFLSFLQSLLLIKKILNGWMVLFLNCRPYFIHNLLFYEEKEFQRCGCFCSVF